MAGFGRNVTQVETIDEIQAGQCLRSLNLLGHEDIRKIVVVQTEEAYFLIDTNVTLHPEKTKLDYGVHPIYRILDNIYHVGYFTIEKKTFIDFDFKISESDTIVSIDFSGEILQKFINDISEPYDIPRYVTHVFGSRGPRFENPTPTFGHSHQDQNTLISGYEKFKSKKQLASPMLDETHAPSEEEQLCEISNNIETLIKFKNKGIGFDEVDALRSLLDDVTLLSEMIVNRSHAHSNQNKYDIRKHSPNTNIQEIAYKDFLSLIPTHAALDTSFTGFISLESTSEDDLGLYDHLLADIEHLGFISPGNEVMCVYTQEGYCVGVLDDAGRLFNRGGFYVTTLKMKLKNMQHIKEALKTYETTCVTKDDISEALVVDRKTDIAYALHKDSADYLSGEKQADKDCSSAHILILHRIYVPVYNRHTLNFVGVMDSEYNIYDTRGVYVATGSINKKNKQRKNPLSSNNRLQ